MSDLTGRDIFAINDTNSDSERLYKSHPSKSSIFVLQRLLPMKFRTILSLLSALIVVPATVLAGSGSEAYTFIDLGTLGGNDSGALGVNDMGQVVGWSTIPGCTTGMGSDCRHAFLWENGVMTDLGFLPGDEGSTANSINNAGVIIGNSERDVIFGSGSYRAVIWNSVGAPSALPDLGDGSSYANDINESGMVVGYATDPMGSQDRVVTWQAGAINNLGAGDWHQYNRGLGINDVGFLVGMAWDLFSPNDSIYFNGMWNQIGGFGQFENSEAYDINNAGRVGGTQAFPSGNWHAAMWDLGEAGATDLGVLPGHALAYLLDVNEEGSAVGYSLYEAGPVYTRAVYTDGVTLTNVNSMLPAGTNAILLDAQQINENGDIVGAAEINGESRAYMLKKNPVDGNYCFTNPNSTGQAAAMSVNGSTSISANNFQLIAQPVPSTTRLFFYGPEQIELPFGDGIRCVGGSIQRLLPATAGGNQATRVVDLIGDGFVPGVLNFQCWFRDPAAHGAGFNLSDGFRVTFMP
ncbi:MAG: putative HAF family extracellular repeat protein [Candidatus Paceibacteria bacterium]|jgi:probable HAF family extracellular repeat protein